MFLWKNHFSGSTASKYIAAMFTIFLGGCGANSPSFSAAQGIYTPDNRETITDLQRFPYIVAIGRDDAQEGCAGFFIDDDHIVTALHCRWYVSKFKLQATAIKLNDRYTGSQRTPQGAEWDGSLQVVEEGMSQGGRIFQDYLIAKVQWNGAPKAVTPAKLAKALPDIGAPVSTIGYPVDRDGDLTLASCKLLSQDFVGDIVYNCSQTSQNSGGPAISAATGEVIGIVSNSPPGVDFDPDAPDLARHSRAFSVQVLRDVSPYVKANQ